MIKRTITWHGFFTAVLLLVTAAYSLTNYANELTPSRNMKLEKFNPYRTEFTCVHQDTVAPPLDPQADSWFEQAKRLADLTLMPAKRDYVTAAKLYAQAAAKKHWKAQLNLATLYLEGAGVEQNIDKAVQLVEEAMRWGVPAAYDRMGIYFRKGYVRDKDPATRAYAFWQKAAEMGNPDAQTFLGSHLLLVEEQADEPAMWANRPIGIKMMECAYDQGFGKAAYELGFIYKRPPTAEGKRKALITFHQGVKWGNADCANFLFTDFGGFGLTTGENISGLDSEREKRYAAIAHILRTTTGTTLPNLDKILPLPPAKLPFWDGNPESLINTAKAVVPVQSQSNN